MPARPSTVASAPLTAEAAALLTMLAATLVPVFFLVEETLLPVEAPMPRELTLVTRDQALLGFPGRPLKSGMRNSTHRVSSRQS